MARANALSKAVADPCQVVKTRNRNRRRVLTWFAGRWRNHQSKRAEKPHSKVDAARRQPALPRGRKLRLSRRMASGSRQPPQGARPMSARERECGELPSPKFVPVQPRGWAGTFCFAKPAAAPPPPPPLKFRSSTPIEGSRGRTDSAGHQSEPAPVRDHERISDLYGLV